MRLSAVLLLLACAACAGPKPHALRPPAPECMARYCFHDGQRLRCAQLCPPPPMRYSTTCGDGWCMGDAELATCRADCFCGNGACQGLENNDSCPADCKCGDGVCDPSESAATCPDDCRCPGVAALGGSATLTLQAVMPSGGYRCLTRGGVTPARP